MQLLFDLFSLSANEVNNLAMWRVFSRGSGQGTEDRGCLPRGQSPWGSEQAFGKAHGDRQGAQHHQGGELYSASDSAITAGGALQKAIHVGLVSGFPENKRIKKKGVSMDTPLFHWRPLGESNPCRRRERAVSWASRRWGPWTLSG